MRKSVESMFMRRVVRIPLKVDRYLSLWERDFGFVDRPNPNEAKVDFRSGYHQLRVHEVATIPRDAFTNEDTRPFESRLSFWVLYIMVNPKAPTRFHGLNELGLQAVLRHPQAVHGQFVKLIQTLEDIMKACVVDFGDSYQLSIRCAPFEALYGRKCRSPVLWANIRESSLTGLELVLETAYKVVLVKKKPKAARDCQKSYVDYRRKPLEFEVGDRVLLKKCLTDANLHVPLDEIMVDKILRFVEEPVEIMDREIRKMKRRKRALVKVRWNSKRGPEFTWEHEDQMRIKYPQLLVIPLGMAKGGLLTGIHGMSWRERDLVWILESCEQSRLWWNKEQNVIPRALGWSRKEAFNRYDYNLLFGKEFKVNVDLAATISELKSDWYIGFQNFFMRYIPRNAPVNRNDLYEDYFKKLSAAHKQAKIATTDLPMVFGREITDVSLENLEFRQYFLNMGEDLCTELKHDFNELISSPLYAICPSIQDNDFDDDVIKLAFARTKDDERGFVKRLKEEVRIRVEKEKLVNYEKEKNKRRHALMNSDHWKASTSRINNCKRSQRSSDFSSYYWGSSYTMAAKDRDYNNLSAQDMTQFLKDVKPWAEELLRPNRATDRVHITDDFDLFLGRRGPLRCRTAKARWAMVGAYFVQILLQDSIPVWYADGSRYKVAWRDLDQVFMLINEIDTHWCLAHLDLPSGVVTFYDSGPTYDIEWREWYILLRECLQVVIKFGVSCKEWNFGDDQLRLRWMIYLVVLADVAENVIDAIGFEYCLASSSGWTKSSVLWAEIGESSLIGLDYADKRRKPLEFEVGDRVLLRVSPWKGMRFGKKGKIAPRYVGPFEILKRISLVAYRLRLPEELNSVHDTFHVSNLKKCLVDANLHEPLDEIKVDKTLRFVEGSL
ncbi:putative reverse transcriptase domain-containing protein [Tanacetum coccineum]|uniref:Reverse transcriptase domain-containing protein n=1 Tax=Tanacetum coccineum TaxID=301880 RepID=A0ABQ5HU86_9ASTR